MHRIDCISLDPIPKRYEIQLGTSYHDARTVAEYMISGGVLHPLSRTAFTSRDFMDVSRKVSGDLRDRVLDIGRDVANEAITSTLGIIRAINFLNVVYSYEQEESLWLIVLTLHCIDTKADIGEYAETLNHTSLAHAVFASRPDIDPKRIRLVLDSSSIQLKCDFLDDIESLLVDFEMEYFTKFMKNEDLFKLIYVLSKYNVKTDFM